MGIEESHSIVPMSDKKSVGHILLSQVDAVLLLSIDKVEIIRNAPRRLPLGPPRLGKPGFEVTEPADCRDRPNAVLIVLRTPTVGEQEELPVARRQFQAQPLLKPADFRLTGRRTQTAARSPLRVVGTFGQGAAAGKRSDHAYGALIVGEGIHHD
ncbi:hypothetical protein GCM10027612_83240 [Microbispora bryophytorum subsp. camponoti]